MKIAIIGTGNVGGALAQGWAKAGHQIDLGVRDSHHFKGSELLEQFDNITAHSIPEAVQNSEVILIAATPKATQSIAEALGNVQDKVIIDAMNTIGVKPGPYNTTAEALLAWTNCKDVVKCFNTTGFENMLHPTYGDSGIDMFVAGDSQKGKAIATQLAKDFGFAACYDFGGNDKFALIEQFALCWINLAIMQKQGRDIAFKVIRR
jgi:predicted dinucleotide-binding enzyme